MVVLVAKQPQKYSQLIGNSIRLYRASFKKVIPFALLLAIIAFTPRFIAIALGKDIFLGLAPNDIRRWWALPINLVAIIFFVGMLWHMHCVLHRKKEPFIEDLLVGLKKVLIIFIATLIQGVLIMLYSIFIYNVLVMLFQHRFFEPSNLMMSLLMASVTVAIAFSVIYLSSLFLFIMPLIAIENKGVFSAIKRSILLVWNHWWRTVSIQFTPWVCYIALLIFIKYLLNIDIHIYLSGDEETNLIASLMQMVIFMLFIPWVAALMIVQVHDLELRNHLVRR